MADHLLAAAAVMLGTVMRGGIMVLGLASLPLGLAGPGWTTINLISIAVLLVLLTVEFLAGRRERAATVSGAS